MTNSQAPQPAQAPELVYSTSGEDWHLGDFSELIDELHSNGEGLDLARRAAGVTAPANSIPSASTST